MSFDPGRIRSLHLVMVTVALAGFPLGATVMGAIFGDFGWRLLLIGLSTALLSAWAARATLRVPRAPGSALGVGFGLTVVAAICNSPLSFALVGISTLEIDALFFVPVGLLFAFVFGVVLTLPLGLAFGALYAPLFAFVQSATVERSLEARIRTLRICGVWLGLVGALGAVTLSRFVDAGDVGSILFFLLSALYAALILGGLAVAGSAHARVLARRAWIGRVARGDVPGWSLRPLDDVEQLDLSGLPRFAATKAPAESVLVHQADAVGQGAYRSGDHAEPIALV